MRADKLVSFAVTHCVLCDRELAALNDKYAICSPCKYRLQCVGEDPSPYLLTRWKLMPTIVSPLLQALVDTATKHCGVSWEELYLQKHDQNQRVVRARCLVVAFLNDPGVFKVTTRQIGTIIRRTRETVARMVSEAEHLLETDAALQLLVEEVKQRLSVRSATSP